MPDNLHDNLEVILNDSGEIAGVKHEIKMNTLNVREFARMLKEAKKTNPNFESECRVIGVIPFFLPDGTFTPDKHAMNIDNDQLDFLLRQCPDFDTDLKTGRSR